MSGFEQYKRSGIERPEAGECLLDKHFNTEQLHMMALIPVAPKAPLSALWERIEIPKQMVDLREIICAIDAWDYCDPEPLAALLKQERKLPGFPLPFDDSKLLPVIGKIVSGERKPNRRGAAKLKIPAKHRLPLAWVLSMRIGAYKAILSTQLDGKTGVDAFTEFANNRRYQHSKRTGKPFRLLPEIEPIVLYRGFQRGITEEIEATAYHWSVSTETLENLLRDFRKKVLAWPCV